MKRLCDRCTVSGCLLDYMGKGCQNARKDMCPDVRPTRLDAMDGMGCESLVSMLADMVAEVKDCDDYREAVRAWLETEVEE